MEGRGIDSTGTDANKVSGIKSWTLEYWIALSKEKTRSNEYFIDVNEGEWIFTLISFVLCPDCVDRCDCILAAMFGQARDMDGMC